MRHKFRLREFTEFEQGNSITGEHKSAQIYFQLLDSLFSFDAIAVSKRTKTKWPLVTRLLGEPLFRRDRNSLRNLTRLGRPNSHFGPCGCGPMYVTIGT